MGSLGSFLIVYVLGGLTFIPLVLSLVLLFVYLTLPDAPPSQTRIQASDAVRRSADDEYSLKSGTDQLAEEFHRTHDSDVAAGYFAVCREYVPGGVNGKPPERTTPAGEVVAAESPSVYQSMYRSLFDRKQAPSIEPAKLNGKNTKRARNVFYIVLRHGHLMLYDDANQVEVRYVISLAHHAVSIFGGEGEIPEGELWIKRNAICLSRRLDSLGDLGGPTPPFYLFSENLSEKEDFYFAMLQNQSKMRDSADRPPKHQEFDVKHIVTLVQRLHSSEEQLQTRWINAFLGRLFLALYQTPEMEEFLRSKITKKISRVNKPNFISKIGLHRIVMGDGAPFITNPRLKDLTADGNCCIEADLQYTGNFRVEISATVRIDLGPRFKAREVDIVLAVVLKKLEGHLLVRFKPPPSNRFWMSFETMPQMSMDIQPIVSSKQITFSPILRTIESKIREVMAESIVLPFWDDVPFLNTMGQAFRGGIWQREVPDHSDEAEIPDESGDAPATPKTAPPDPIEVLKAKDDRTMSMPVLPDSGSPKVKSRRGPKSLSSDTNIKSSTATSTGVERSDITPLPRAIRSQTFSHAADPVVTADNANFNKAESETKGDEKSSATSAMIEISSRSPPASPQRTPGSSPPTGGLMIPESAVHSRGSSIAESLDGLNFSNDHVNNFARFEGNPNSSTRSSRGSSTVSLVSEKPRRSTMETLTKSITNTFEDKTSNINIGTTAAAAKKWSWGVFGKGESNARQETARSTAGTPEQPIGRGHPHPAPGAPLPRPDKFALKRNSTSNTLPKRKPVGPIASPGRPNAGSSRPVPPPPLPRRKPIPPIMRPDGVDELLVVEAPQDSAPNSPIVGELDLDEGSNVTGLHPSENSSRINLAETESHSEDEEGQEDQSLQSIDQTGSSPTESQGNVSFLEQVEVPLA
ncbi:hypothetical protein N7466_006169 [Penicillium verhagenii]|uniref:uncharacterized protein n=1 Tax=Penicillium verhagenii TaxID=1562060 RepID=UPI0025456D5B|nr:uncharacterized protein N7466_006169 [Penicillium verhagenii]KAJ5930676.1 hypothetical protein N7466_006169 [Penicillium verhagenii]